jgi:hypothetical protein
MTAVALRRYYEEEQWPPPLGTANYFSQSVSEPVGYQRPQVSIPSTVTEPKWVAPTIARMRQLGALKDDWDQRGSAEVSFDALVFAWGILGQVMPPNAPPPAIVPLGHGGVQLLWNNAACDLEVEVVRPNEVIMYHLDNRTGREEETPLTMELSALTNILWSYFRT